METDILDDKPEEQSKTDEGEALIEAVKEKYDVNQKEEKITDIFTIQLILCVLIVMIFTVVNIFDTTISGWFIDRFKQMTNGETEKIFIEAINYTERLLK